MTHSPDDEFEDDHSDPLDDDLEEDFPRGDGTADMEAEVQCPWCGERVTIGLDPGSGTHQQYTEDCQVCCRPWTVHVSFDLDGAATAYAEAEGDWDDA
jgi:hypothetical protein